MEALDFLKERVRMCHSIVSGCTECPLSLTMNKYHETCSELMRHHPEEAVMIVERWSKEHPLVTNEMKFREVFGDNAVNSVLAVHMSDIKRWLAEPYKERES